MSNRLTRRTVLAGAGSLLGSAALGQAPTAIEPPPLRGMPRRAPANQPSNPIVERAGLSGAIAYALLDAGTGEVVETRLGDARMSPASTLKAVTSLYGLERLGPRHRFETRILATGTRRGGRIEGDLILAGGGDPTLDTDRLAELAIALRESGITEVRGRFLVWQDALPTGRHINRNQPDHVGYNPAFGGLNLNYNRVHFEWKRAGEEEWEITMQARARRFRPATDVAQMRIDDRRFPVFAYQRALAGRGDRWSVAKSALGSEGARWLPVRVPGLYCADVFRTLARSNGIVLKGPELVAAVPTDAVPLAHVESAPLQDMLRGMMRYSTNLTAEAVGLAASLSNGVPVNSLVSSGARMAGWSMGRHGATDIQFRDHSGLGYASAVTPVALARILTEARAARPLMQPVTVPGEGTCVAKTGTLNFVSSLAGYLTARSGREFVFAILTADVSRRDAIPPEERERPPGARSWSRRSRNLQKALLANWATL